MSVGTIAMPRSTPVFVNRQNQVGNNRRQELQQIAHKVKVLRAFTRDTGFFTTRSVGTLLQNLSPEELVIIAELSATEPQPASK